MGFKLYASGVTTPIFTDAAYDFRENPSADNWIKLDRAMKAHQAARLTPEATLRHILEDLERGEIFNRLVQLYDDIQEFTEKAYEAGHIQIFRADQIDQAA